jgi:hypothetical protein
MAQDPEEKLRAQLHSPPPPYCYDRCFTLPLTDRRNVYSIARTGGRWYLFRRDEGAGEDAFRAERVEITEALAWCAAPVP